MVPTEIQQGADCALEAWPGWFDPSISDQLKTMKGKKHGGDGNHQRNRDNYR